MQFNCNGLRNQIADITNYMYNNKIRIAALQETKLPRECPITSSGNYIARKDRERDNGGGLAFVLERNFKCKVTNTPAPPNPDNIIEVMSISIKTEETEIEIANVYIPPVNSIGKHYHPSITHLLQRENRIILGDFNANHESWYSLLPNDQRGIAIAKQIEESDFATRNEPYSTRVTARCSSSPDLTIVNRSLLANTT